MSRLDFGQSRTPTTSGVTLHTLQPRHELAAAGLPTESSRLLFGLILQRGHALSHGAELPAESLRLLPWLVLPHGGCVLQQRDALLLLLARLGQLVVHGHQLVDLRSVARARKAACVGSPRWRVGGFAAVCADFTFGVNVPLGYHKAPWRAEQRLTDFPAVCAALALGVSITFGRRGGLGRASDELGSVAPAVLFQADMAPREHSSVLNVVLRPACSKAHAATKSVKRRRSCASHCPVAVA
mmetsp:Transcript_59029/g.137434  ORF Transcript_59029/g.137434 Transcript_59029/m.137434 type:complete len:241 (+) Transcript_59029:637-1359(+)